jgi:hypothetical protein
VLALIDLDGTLVDRDRGCALWARGFVAERDLGEGALTWLEQTDREVKERGEFFALVSERFPAAGSASVLWNDYRAQMPGLAPASPGVLDALARLRERGWRLGVSPMGGWTTKSASCAALESWPYWMVGASRKRRGYASPIRQSSRWRGSGAALCATRAAEWWVTTPRSTSLAARRAAWAPFGSAMDDRGRLSSTGPIGSGRHQCKLSPCSTPPNDTDR